MITVEQIKKPKVTIKIEKTIRILDLCGSGKQIEILNRGDTQLKL